MASVIEPHVKTRRWRRVEYERLVGHTGQVLASAFGPGWHPRLHAPLALDDDSEPEPDIAIVAGEPRDYLTAHPSTAARVRRADSCRRRAALSGRE